MKTVDIQIPFMGFYESWHDEKCSDAVESAFNYDQETGSDKELPDCFWDANINWSAIHNDYAKEYAKAFMEEFGFTGEFAELSSPRYYNYSTDRIFITVPKKQIDAIKAKVFADEKARAFVSEQFTSRDGFSSHYSNDLKDEDWTKEPLDECQYGVILEAYIELQEREENFADWGEREWALVEDFELSSWDSVIDAQAEVEKAIKEAEIKDAINDINGAMDELDNFYLGVHNMPLHCEMAFKYMKQAVKKLEVV